MDTPRPFSLARLCIALAALLGGAPAEAAGPPALESLYVLACGEPSWMLLDTTATDVSDPGARSQPEGRKAEVVTLPLRAGEKLALGSTVATGSRSWLKLLLDGHTVVDIAPGSLIGFPVEWSGRTVRGKDQKLTLVVVYKGAARTYTDSRYLDDDASVALIAQGQRQWSRGGVMVAGDIASVSAAAGDPEETEER